MPRSPTPAAAAAVGDGDPSMVSGSVAVTAPRGGGCNKLRAPTGGTARLASPAAAAEVATGGTAGSLPSDSGAERRAIADSGAGAAPSSGDETRPRPLPASVPLARRPTGTPAAAEPAAVVTVEAAAVAAAAAACKGDTGASASGRVRNASPPSDGGSAPSGRRREGDAVTCGSAVASSTLAPPPPLGVPHVMGVPPLRTGRVLTIVASATAAASAMDGVPVLSPMRNPSPPPPCPLSMLPARPPSPPPAAADCATSDKYASRAAASASAKSPVAIGATMAAGSGRIAPPAPGPAAGMPRVGVCCGVGRPPPPPAARGGVVAGRRIASGGGGVAGGRRIASGGGGVMLRCPPASAMEPVDCGGWRWRRPAAVGSSPPTQTADFHAMQRADDGTDSNNNAATQLQ